MSGRSKLEPPPVPPAPVEHQQTHRNTQQQPQTQQPKAEATTAGAVQMTVGYDYTSDDGAMVVKEGETVTLTDELDAVEGWTPVKTAAGKEGYVPTNYLVAKTVKATPVAAVVATQPAKVVSKPAESESVPAGYTRGKVTYDYQAQSDTDVSVTANDPINYIPDDGSGWVYCITVSGKEGYVPANYVE
ncbi:hypothetical protein BLNAU_20049 [Blattamonas nauphoetae]|uniref:SH3 domain-containing protein n=1 Tax=Blattamonas nauphoetae TaxID=2049346 RepID=A0ABQ9WZS8_9EUKA|nr:hypothetical protein BLNAU_20049 [Blattamonas nauphoetae]